MTRATRVMFRITSESEGDPVLKVEGCLAGPCVPELEACWRELSARVNGRTLGLDLRDVCHVDEAGRELMTRMYLAGVEFTARGCAITELVREIAASVAPLGRD
jgi:hypothetical protein